MTKDYWKDYRWDGNTCWLGHKKAGYINGDTYYRFGNEEQHHLHSPPSWCFDSRQVADLDSRGIREVAIVLGDDCIRASLSLLRETGFCIDREHGRQVCLADKHWWPDSKGAKPGQMCFVIQE